MWGGEQNCNPAIQAQIDSLRNQMADNQNSNLLMDAVHGNTAAITQLAGNLNCDFNALNGAILFTETLPLKLVANLVYMLFLSC